jgi:hypothetical protein
VIITRRTKVSGCLIAILVAIGIPAGCAYRKLMWELDPPERGFGGEQVFTIPVDAHCIKAALSQEFGDVHNMQFLGEETEDVFNYYNSADGGAWILLGLTETPGGTRVSHSFIGHGRKMPKSEFPPALAAMRRATATIHARCKVDLSRMKMKEIGQRVDALR